MQKFTIVFFLIILFFSCHQKKETESVDELLLIGYSSFLLKDSANNHYTIHDLKHCDSVNLEWDSTQLDIKEYFEYKKNGFVKIALKKTNKETEYHKISQFDTIGLESIMNKTLINKSFKNEYSEDVAYDGLRYTLFFKTTYGNELTIDYFPSALTDTLNALYEFIHGIITNENSIFIEKFDYNPVITREAKRIFKNYPPLPLPTSLTKEVFFISPKH